MPSFQLTKLWEDELGEVCLLLEAANDYVSVRHEFRTYPEVLERWSHQLAVFPFDVPEPVFEAGEATSQRHLCIITRVYNASGHALLHIVTRDQPRDFSFGLADFSLTCSVAEVSELSRRLHSWLADMNGSLAIEWKNTVGHTP